MLLCFDTALRMRGPEFDVEFDTEPAWLRDISKHITISPGLNRLLPSPESPDKLAHVSNQSMRSNDGYDVPHIINLTPVPSTTLGSRPSSPRLCEAELEEARALICLKYGEIENEEVARALITLCVESATSTNSIIDGNSTPSLLPSPGSDTSNVLISDQIPSKIRPLDSRVTRQTRQEHATGLEFEALGATMSPRSERLDPVRSRRKHRSDHRSPEDRLLEEAIAEAGGEPADDASKEDWDRYLGNCINALDQRSASSSWPQLEKAEQFIKKMGQAPFRRRGYSSDEDDPPKDGTPTPPDEQKVKAEKGQNDQNGQNENSQVTTTLPEGCRKMAESRKYIVQAAEKLDELKDVEKSTKRNDMKASASKAFPPDSAADHNASPRKKRRTVLDSLESDLGKNWDVHVDEQGHRPTRKKASKP
ncbi:hypothetical protein F5Y11DRAFT_242576 [Daldinia sp. FL1419]|nr:hypothetical protein F5Y11DRAFT_242576 [Daldinia sp. FL1419]